MSSYKISEIASVCSHISHSELRAVIIAALTVCANSPRYLLPNDPTQTTFAAAGLLKGKNVHVICANSLSRGLLSPIICSLLRINPGPLEALLDPSLHSLVPRLKLETAVLESLIDALRNNVLPVNLEARFPIIASQTPEASTPEESIAEVSVPEESVPEDSVTKVSVPEVRSAEVSAFKVCAAKVSASKVRSATVSVPEEPKFLHDLGDVESWESELEEMKALKPELPAPITDGAKKHKKPVHHTKGTFSRGGYKGNMEGKNNRRAKLAATPNDKKGKEVDDVRVSAPRGEYKGKRGKFVLDRYARSLNTNFRGVSAPIVPETIMIDESEGAKEQTVSQKRYRRGKKNPKKPVSNVEVIDLIVEAVDPKPMIHTPILVIDPDDPNNWANMMDD